MNDLIQIKNFLLGEKFTISLDVATNTTVLEAPDTEIKYFFAFDYFSKCVRASVMINNHAYNLFVFDAVSYTFDNFIVVYDTVTNWTFLNYCQQVQMVAIRKSQIAHHEQNIKTGAFAHLYDKIKWDAK